VVPTYPSTPALTLSERVDAERAIERIYWAHRVWPRENPAPKPAFEAICPESTLRARVVDTLRKSRTIELEWGRPITHDQLQAELDRMAAGTQDPKLLEEIFTALHHDPRLIAESLARPALVDRLIRGWYDNDRRFHDGRRREAESAAARIVTGDDMKSLAPEYFEIEWSRRTASTPRRHTRGRRSR
jgi:hypothetical protein